MRTLPLLVALCACLACGEAPPRAGGPAEGWPVYAHDPGGTRYSPLDEITPENARFLELAWEYHTEDFAPEGRRLNHSFEATPILVGDSLYFCTPSSWIVSLDAETGAERWVFDPEVDPETSHGNHNCRGVAHWRDPEAQAGAPCRDRIYVATSDARLIAVDAESGQRCSDFGAGGDAEFWSDVEFLAERREIGISSPPVVVRDVVVLGSAVSENRRTDMPSGKVHAFHARSGELLWTWDPIPKDPADPAFATWENGSALRTGAANVWSLGSADAERDLVFLPTSSPSPDWYGGERLGDNLYADSVVALRGSTGELVWHFQTVHHDLWDYDLASQPVLIDFPLPDGTTVPAVAQGTKMGNLFFLDRETGAPLIPVEERPVPQTDVPGERTSPTQPFPTWPPPLAPQHLDPDRLFAFTIWDEAKCRELLAGLRNDGIFTPPSFEGSLVYPGTAGGSNWGSVAYDPVRKLLIVNTTSVAQIARLVRREDDDGTQRWSSNMEGTPYVARGGVFISPWFVPCDPPPWGSLTALDLGAREQSWRVPLGTSRDQNPLGISIRYGVPNMGGPITTAGGVVFIGATMDDYLRAFDAETGQELWKGRLPAGGQATPMTYRLREDGRQFVVIAAGGHSMLRTRKGDSVMAFALP